MSVEFSSVLAERTVFFFFSPEVSSRGASNPGVATFLGYLDMELNQGFWMDDPKGGWMSGWTEMDGWTER